VKRIISSAVLVYFLLVVSSLMAAEIAVEPGNQTGVYKSGEEASWNISIKNSENGANGQVSYTVSDGGSTKVAEGKVDVKDGKAVVKATKKEPGTLLLSVNYGKDKGLGGAVFDWTGIKPSAEEPADFDKFWQDKIAGLEAVPMNVQLEKLDEPGDVDYWKITMDNVNGSKIYGQLAKSKNKEGKLPAILQVQWAGVYPLKREWVTGFAKQGWLAMNIIAHDIPIDKDEAFYKEQNDGALKDYSHQGNDDRDKSYFLRMYLSCYRAVEYLSQRPDWDGRTLFVTGGSQGGLQAVMVAGLNHKVTAIAASVPAGCDHTGDLVGRASGWPKWIRSVDGKDKDKVIAASKYYDVVNFARRVKCPALVGIGLIDNTCPPAGTIAMFNQIPGTEKRLVICPLAEHQNKNNSHTPYYQVYGKWTDALSRGKPLDMGK